MLSNGAYANCWNVQRESERYVDVQISTSRKNKDGNYETDFSGIVRLVGKALENYRAKGVVPNRDNKVVLRMQIVRCGVSSTYDSEKKTTFFNFTVFEAEFPDSQRQQAPVQAAPAAAPAPAPVYIPENLEGDDDILPFA